MKFGDTLKRQITFIHAADLHIDAPFKGMATLPASLFEATQKSTYRAFDRLIETAIEKRVDFVLIVGDLFDQDNRSLHAQIYVRDGFAQLEQYGIEVFVSYGNHDYVKGNKYPITFTSNVHVFPGEDVTSFTYLKENEPLAEIYGFSYEYRAVTENKVPQYERKDASIPFHIATLHGSLSGNDEHDPYAPFLLEEMKEKPFDYWALGHIHTRTHISEHPPIVYPGNIQGRHRKETGEKGCYYCVMDKDDISLTFIPLQSILFVEHIVDISDVQSVGQFEVVLENLYQSAVQPQFNHVIFHSSNDYLLQLDREGIIEDFIMLWNEQYQLLPNWQHIYDYKIDFQEAKSQDQFFIAELRESLNSISIQDAVLPLWKEQNVRRHVEKMDEETVVEEAEKLLHYYFSQT